MYEGGGRYCDTYNRAEGCCGGLEAMAFDDYQWNEAHLRSINEWRQGGMVVGGKRALLIYRRSGE
jgi:hypothetical protein